MKFYLLFLSFFFSLGANANCLKEGNKISLSGTLINKIYPGPPNYEDIKQGDRPIKAWILKLDNKLSCIDDIAPTAFYEGWQTEVRLREVSNEDIDYEKFNNSHVTVSGNLFIVGMANDLTAILLDPVSDIKIDK